MFALLLQAAGLLPPAGPPVEHSPFELTTIVDDATIDPLHRRCIKVLVRITNVDGEAHALPITASYAGRLDLVDARNGQAYATFPGCTGGRDRNAGQIVPAGGFVDAMVTLCIGSALDDRITREIRVRYRHERIEHLRTFDPIAQRLNSTEVFEGPVVDVPGIEVVGPVFEIRREDAPDHLRRQQVLNQIRGIEGGVWQCYQQSRGGPSWSSDMAAPVFDPVRGVCLNAEDRIRDIFALGPHEEADDALFSMGLTAWSEGDLEDSAVFFVALETHYPLSTGVARLHALRRFGWRYAWFSNGW